MNTFNDTEIIEHLREYDKKKATIMVVYDKEEDKTYDITIERVLTVIENQLAEIEDYSHSIENLTKDNLRLRKTLEKRTDQCDQFEKLVEKALACCDDKDSQLDRLFEVVEDWKKACENTRRLAYEEVKLIPGCITRKKINKLMKEKGL